jgi:xylulose-5-phosphate/fructose-6-phosphate phosphoketolase
MPGQEIDRPDPPPLTSQLPDRTLDLAVNPERKQLDAESAQGLRDFQNAACYIAACKCQIVPWQQLKLIDRDG